jgi:hypothetical protein
MFVVVVIVVVLLWEKLAKTVCMTSLVQALTTIIEITVFCFGRARTKLVKHRFLL